MIKLFLIRHAKSSWKDASLGDFNRPLNTRGKGDLPKMGNRLLSDKIIPDAIVTSPAKRAFSTASAIAEKISFPLKSIQTDPLIYEASASTLLRIINEFNDTHQTYFIFGHNPGFTSLAEILSGKSFGNLPTCSVVGIEFPFDSWALVSADTGNCVYYNYPKKEQ